MVSVTHGSFSGDKASRFNISPVPTFSILTTLVTIEPGLTDTSIPSSFVPPSISTILLYLGLASTILIFILEVYV